MASSTRESDAHLFDHEVLPRAALDAMLVEYASLAKRHGPQSAHALRQRNAVACKMLKLVHSIASRFRAPRGMDAEDLRAYGYEGLLVGIEKYDPTLGYALTTYAPHWIKHHIRRAIHDLGAVVRVPVHACEALTREQAGKEGPTPKASVMEDARAARRVSSLDATASTTDGETRTRIELTAGEFVDPVDTMDTEQSTADVRAALARLPERERWVIEQRMEGLTLSQVGEKIGRSRERIRQIEAEAYTMLRVSLKEHAPERAAEGSIEQHATPEAVAALPPRLRTVLEMRAMGRTLKQVGHELGVSHESVRTLERNARESLRASA